MLSRAQKLVFTACEAMPFLRTLNDHLLSPPTAEKKKWQEVEQRN